MSGSQIDAGAMDVPFKDHGRGVFQFEDLTGPAIVNIPDEETTININNPGPILPIINPTNIPSSDLQPDSEPGAIPTDVNSNAYTPPTPLSDQSQGNLPEDVELEPKDIPIPSDSSDDGLMVEDYWIQRKNKLIRVHQTPRKQAFNPTMTMDCPVDILHLSDERYTAGNAHDQALWAKQDVWDLNDSNWQSETAWTGVTIFSIVEEAGQPCDAVDEVFYLDIQQCFSCEIFLNQDDMDSWSHSPEQFAMVASAAAKRQRAEIKVKDLNPEELEQFRKAKDKEINQWLDTATVRKVMRDKIPSQNILRCRWVLTWKDLDAVDAAKEGRSRKAKARLVILGYEDPDITDIPRDSPALQKESRSLVLQLCASRK
jgi:hypothetical protein